MSYEVNPAKLQLPKALLTQLRPDNTETGLHSDPIVSIRNNLLSVNTSEGIVVGGFLEVNPAEQLVQLEALGIINNSQENLHELDPKFPTNIDLLSAMIILARFSQIDKSRQLKALSVAEEVEADTVTGINNSASLVPLPVLVNNYDPSTTIDPKLWRLNLQDKFSTDPDERNIQISDASLLLDHITDQTILPPTLFAIGVNPTISLHFHQQLAEFIRSLKEHTEG